MYAIVIGDSEDKFDVMEDAYIIGLAQEDDMNPVLVETIRKDQFKRYYQANVETLKVIGYEKEGQFWSIECVVDQGTENEYDTWICVYLAPIME